MIISHCVILQQEQVQQVLWLLKHRLLQQLHTYVYLSPPVTIDTGVRFGLHGESLCTLGSQGTSSPASTSIPTPTVHEPPSLLPHDSTTSQTQLGHHRDVTQESLHHAVVQLSQPASESDLGSGELRFEFFRCRGKRSFL